MAQWSARCPERTMTQTPGQWGVSAKLDDRLSVAASHWDAAMAWRGARFSTQPLSALPGSAQVEPSARCAATMKLA